MHIPEAVTVSDNLDRLVAGKDIWSALKISPAKFYSLVAEGKLPPPLKIGRAARWKASDIQAFVQTCEPTPKVAEVINEQAT